MSNEYLVLDVTTNVNRALVVILTQRTTSRNVIIPASVKGDWRVRAIWHLKRWGFSTFEYISGSENFLREI